MTISVRLRGVETVLDQPLDTACLTVHHEHANSSPQHTDDVFLVKGSRSQDVVWDSGVTEPDTGN